MTQKIKQENIDRLATMLLRSRELAVDGSMEQVLPALDAALLITGREMARRAEEGDWFAYDTTPHLN